MKGYLEQEGIPTPDNPVKIKTQVIGNNLFKTYEVNGRKYTDNLPKNALISVPKEQFIEYEQQKEEIERLNNILDTAIGIANERVNYYYHINKKEILEEWENIFDVLVERDNQELKGSDKE